MPSPAHPAHARVREAAARRGVSIEILTFEVSTHTAQEAAAAIGVELGQIVKSLVFMAPFEGSSHTEAPEAVMALVRGTDRVDIAKLGAAIGSMRLRRATAREAATATGYVIGGIPPFGHHDPIRVVMDPALDAYAEVWAAAGTPNAVFAIEPQALAQAADAVVAACAEGPDAAVDAS